MGLNVCLMHGVKRGVASHQHPPHLYMQIQRPHEIDALFPLYP